MKKKKDGEYLAPQIKVIEIKSQGMMCTSPSSGTESLVNGGDIWTSGF